MIQDIKRPKAASMEPETRLKVEVLIPPDC
jgi:hypothetical protein